MDDDDLRELVFGLHCELLALLSAITPEATRASTMDAFRRHLADAAKGLEEEVPKPERGNRRIDVWMLRSFSDLLAQAQTGAPLTSWKPIIIPGGKNDDPA